MADPIKQDIYKSGESILMVSLQRSHGGVKVTVKASASVENLMREWAGGETTFVENYGLHWKTEDDQNRLKVYSILDRLGTVRIESGYFTLSGVGDVLFSEESASGLCGGCLNMGFLRLVGISAPAGVTFTIKGAFSLEFLKKIQGLIKEAGKKFYQDYLCPIDLTVSVVTQQTKL